MLNINRLDSTAPDFNRRLRKLRTAAAHTDAAVRQTVSNMAERILRNGDTALLALAQKFDGGDAPTVAALETPAMAMQQALADLPSPLRDDLQTAATRLRDYHRQQLKAAAAGWAFTDEYGNRLGETVHPVNRAVIYAPGGKAAYPSSVLMGAIPAVIAGVKEVILTTPPAATQDADRLILAAAALAGVERVFRLGGAHAIIGFALGSETLPAADVIVGPGNVYVTEAKRQMFGRVGIDGLAGPSEVLIISDGSTTATAVATDLAAQAEHDEDAQCLLLSTSAAHLQAVATALTDLLPQQPRREIIRTSLEQHGAFIHAQDLNECITIADRIAAEHVQVMTEDADDIATRLQHAGGIFIGRHACVAMGDYLAGPNHILPTGATARFASPLGVTHFIKRCGIFHPTAAGAAALAPAVKRLAAAEGFPAHAASAHQRTGSDE